MTKNIEIEFKTIISKNQYFELLETFNLKDNIFKQTNYYFDTEDYELNKKHIVLRIRQKGDNHFKVTLKSQSEKGAYENHMLLNKKQANEMIENGFNTSTFFDQTNYDVKYIVNLDNYRVSTPYMGGTLFLDKCVYCNTEDYEIEYEVDHFDTGLKIFEQFLKENNIEYKPTKRKSERAFTCRR